MQFYETAADRQPQPCAAMSPARCPVKLLEILEQARHIVRRDADPGILDRKNNFPALRLHADTHAAAVRKAHRITQQIE